MIANPIAYPIRYPIARHRVCPNRPRIPHIESCHVSPFSGYAYIHRCRPTRASDRTGWMLR